MTLSKSGFSIGFFEILKMFYPPKGAAKAEPKVVQLFLLSILLCLRNGFDTFKVPIFHRPF